MMFESLRRRVGMWLYRKVCYHDQVLVAKLLDATVQDAQGVILQFQAVSKYLAEDSREKVVMEATLVRAEEMLGALRDQAEAHAIRFNLRTDAGNHLT